MQTKLYVGNLSYSTTEDTLRTLFAESGSVASVELIKDRDTGNSKGFAFIEMSNQSESEQAISKFNGYDLDGRQIKVSIARPREERPSSGGWYSDSGSRNYGNKGYGKGKSRGNTRRY